MGELIPVHALSSVTLAELIRVALLRILFPGVRPVCTTIWSLGCPCDALSRIFPLVLLSGPVRVDGRFVGACAILSRVAQQIVMTFEPVTSLDFEALTSKLVKVECRVFAWHGVSAFMSKFPAVDRPRPPEIRSCSRLVQDGKGNKNFIENAAHHCL